MKKEKLFKNEELSKMILLSKDKEFKFSIETYIQQFGLIEHSS